MIASVWGPYRLWHLVLAVLVTGLFVAVLALLVLHYDRKPRRKKKPWVKAELRDGWPADFVPPSHWPTIDRRAGEGE